MEDIFARTICINNPDIWKIFVSKIRNLKTVSQLARNFWCLKEYHSNFLMYYIAQILTLLNFVE